MQTLEIVFLPAGCPVIPAGQLTVWLELRILILHLKQVERLFYTAVAFPRIPAVFSWLGEVSWSVRKPVNRHKYLVCLE